MKKLTRFIVIFIISVLVVQCFDYVVIQAKTKKVATPKISAKVSQKNKSVKITIDKTENASWYVIEMCYIEMGTQFTKVKKLKKDGTAKRSYTKKNLEDGTYLIRVRAFAKNGKKTIKSAYSEEISINIERTGQLEPTPAPVNESSLKKTLRENAEAKLAEMQKVADEHGWSIMSYPFESGKDNVYTIYVCATTIEDEPSYIDGAIFAGYIKDKDVWRVSWREHNMPDEISYSAFIQDHDFAYITIYLKNNGPY